MSIENTELCPDEVARRAEDLYYRDIRPKVMPQEKGKFLTLDIYSGDYEIDEDGLSANKRLRTRRPGGEFFCIRIGYTAANKMSGTLTEDSAR